MIPVKRTLVFLASVILVGLSSINAKAQDTFHQVFEIEHSKDTQNGVGLSRPLVSPDRHYILFGWTHLWNRNTSTFVEFGAKLGDNEGNPFPPKPPVNRTGMIERYAQGAIFLSDRAIVTESGVLDFGGSIVKTFDHMQFLYSADRYWSNSWSKFGVLSGGRGILNYSDYSINLAKVDQGSYLDAFFVGNTKPVIAHVYPTGIQVKQLQNGTEILLNSIRFPEAWAEDEDQPVTGGWFVDSDSAVLLYREVFSGSDSLLYLDLKTGEFVDDNKISLSGFGVDVKKNLQMNRDGNLITIVYATTK